MIAAMMFVTTIDVVGRYFFNHPLFGAFEITEILMGLVIFAGMPLATAAREHITVNFLETVLTSRRRALQTMITDLISAAMSAVFAWRIFERGIALADSGEKTMELGVSRGLIAWIMAGLMAVTALVFVYAAVVAARAAMRSGRS
jgi:TRAP-type C4-dicarboxylate transport system permease small subunit